MDTGSRAGTLAARRIALDPTVGTWFRRLVQRAREDRVLAPMEYWHPRKWQKVGPSVRAGGFRTMGTQAGHVVNKSSCPVLLIRDLSAL